MGHAELLAIRSMGWALGRAATIIFWTSEVWKRCACTCTHTRTHTYARKHTSLQSAYFVPIGIFCSNRHFSPNRHILFSIGILYFLRYRHNQSAFYTSFGIKMTIRMLQVCMYACMYVRGVDLAGAMPTPWSGVFLSSEWTWGLSPQCRRLCGLSPWMVQSTDDCT